MKKQPFGLQLRRIVQPFVRPSSYRHNPLLINSLVRFNFRPPLILEFPGEQLEKDRSSPRDFSTW